MTRLASQRLVGRFLQEQGLSKTAAQSEQEGSQSEGRREIPKDHAYDPKSLKPLAKTLWAASVAMGHALTAYKHLSRLKSATISPDGRLGGKGYVMSIAEMRKSLYSACEALSAITDTLHDEINAPHWKPRLAELDENEAEDVERFVEESQGILENPEEDAEESEREIEEENDKQKGKSKQANSSLPVGVLPGGPRIEHLDRGEEEDFPTVDDWGVPREYLYPSEWANEFREASSNVPDAFTDTTPTEAYDFGLGFGAKGQGAGGYENPSDEGNGKGVWGPASRLPGTSSQSSGDTSQEWSSRADRRQARDLLPGDLDIPVARADYYRGDRGNLVNTQSQLPAEPTPGEELSLSAPNTYYTYEDVSTPYVRYDDTTKDYRKDPLHGWPQGHEDG